MSKLMISLVMAGMVGINGTAEPASPSVAPAATPIGSIQLPPLPYPENALEPMISAGTVGLHYGKHHRTYVDNLNKLIANSELTSVPLEEIIRVTTNSKDKEGVSIFNNAAQIWNHTFYWNSMKPKGGGKPTGAMLTAIEKSFGDYEKFRQAFLDAAMAQFGSGWVWLMADKDGLKVVKTSNADTPVAHNQKALLVCDVWEHAYYLDYQNRRKDYVAAFLDHLVNWDFATAQLGK